MGARTRRARTARGTLTARLSAGVAGVARGLGEIVYRGQFGPAREAEWREFAPRH